jgi:hypothetical protein
MIETLRETNDTKTSAVFFRWQGMNFCLALTPVNEGQKWLSFTNPSALLAQVSPDQRQVSWIISTAEENTPAAGASMTSAETCNGCAACATGESTTGK